MNPIYIHLNFKARETKAYKIKKWDVIALYVSKYQRSKIKYLFVRKYNLTSEIILNPALRLCIELI